MSGDHRIVITGIGLTAPNGNTYEEFRRHLLTGVSGIRNIEMRYMGTVPAGICTFDATRYQNRRDIRNGTRAGSIAIFCANEAVKDAGLAVTDANRGRIGVFVGTTEHGNVETENEIYNISRFNYDIKYWTHHHNPRTVANNPAGEVTINMGITGPHYCIGAACAAGNAGIIQGLQQLLLGEVDVAVCGGVSESPGTFGIFAGFKSQGALAENPDPVRASRPLDRDRNGIVISEGGCLYILERLADARKRNAKIYAEIAGYAMNSDATNAVLPNEERQAQCMTMAIARAGMNIADIDLINTHATGTKMGDAQEINALRQVLAGPGRRPYINNTKGFIGHAMGAAGALELAGNLPSLCDGIVHPCMNLDCLDPDCAVDNIVAEEPLPTAGIRTILNTSFGMVGINSVLIVKKYE
ncbi:MAG: beta-ketoacyl-[acyl-carrier-protein] synthase family protein [Victivallales bacterium]|nr:beta-ketoacyl-[acyl-carrier-protein] synthase family protein [Victivallales bacterium]